MCACKHTPSPVLQLLQPSSMEAGHATHSTFCPSASCARQQLHPQIHMRHACVPPHLHACRLGTATLQFPCHLYFLSPGKLSKYSLASKKTGCFVSLPPIDSSGAPHEAKQLVHSPKQHAWLVFFETRPSVAPAAAGGASRAASPTMSVGVGSSSGSGGSGSCHFTLVHDAAAAGQATWFLPGALHECIRPLLDQCMRLLRSDVHVLFPLTNSSKQLMSSVSGDAHVWC
jgi:hypothetical protein